MPLYRIASTVTALAIAATLMVPLAVLVRAGDGETRSTAHRCQTPHAIEFSQAARPIE